jgi:hypothetical protein
MLDILRKVSAWRPATTERKNKSPVHPGPNALEADRSWFITDVLCCELASDKVGVSEHLAGALFPNWHPRRLEVGDVAPGIRQ